MKRRLRIGAVIVLAAIAVVSILDYAGAFGYPGNYLRNIDRGSFTISKVINGDTVVAHSMTIHLLGVDAPDRPDAHWAENAKTYATNRLLGRTVTLKLDTLEPRSADGNVQGYVYVTDGDCLNFDMTHDGQAYADRRVKHSYHVQFEMAENEARKKSRGLWKELNEEQMPKWRREWLENKEPSH